MNKTQREVFPDILKVAATCGVVLLHTLTGIMDNVSRSLTPWEMKSFLAVMDLICWCVPVFLLISGYLFLNPDREFTFPKMLTKYCRRIVLALFLFGVPFAWMEQMVVERTFRPEMFPKGFLMVLQGASWSHLWYLYLILLLYLLTPALKLLLRKLPLSAVYGLLFLILLGSSFLPYIKRSLGLESLWVLPDGGIYFFYYICGYLFALRKNEKKSGQAAPALLVCTVLLAAGMIASRILGYSLQMAYNYPFTVLLSLLLFGCGQSFQLQHPNTASGTSFWCKAGAVSFTVYLIHPVFLNIYYKGLHISPLDFPFWISLPLFFLGTLIPTVLAAFVLRKITPLRKWVL